MQQVEGWAKGGCGWGAGESLSIIRTSSRRNIVVVFQETRARTSRGEKGNKRNARRRDDETTFLFSTFRSPTRGRFFPSGWIIIPKSLFEHFRLVRERGDCNARPGSSRQLKCTILFRQFSRDQTKVNWSLKRINETRKRVTVVEMPLSNRIVSDLLFKRTRIFE